MHLETIQHLRNVAGQHDDLVPIAKPLLLDLLDSYEHTQLREAGTPACPDALNIVILQQLLKADDYDSIEAVKAAAQDYLHSLNACPLDFAHQPHDHCDGTAASQRPAPPPVNTVNPVTLVPTPETFTAHGGFVDALKALFLQLVPTPETFTAHGHTWTRHTPGDPCPETKGRLIAVLQRRGPAAGWASTWHWKWEPIPNFPQFEIIGWRYAEPQPSTPDK